MTKAIPASTPTLQSFFQAQKTPVTRSRTKSLKTVDTVDVPARAVGRKTTRTVIAKVAGTPATKEKQVRSARSTLKRPSDNAEDETFRETPKKQRRDAGRESGKDELVTIVCSTQELLSGTDPAEDKAASSAANTPGPKNIKGKNSVLFEHKKSDSTTDAVRDQPESTKTPAEKTIRPALKTAPALTFIKIDDQRARGAKVLPSPVGDEQLEVHDPHDTPNTTGVPVTPVSSPMKRIKLTTLSKGLPESPLTGPVPAFQRYSHLLAPEQKLPLPAKYEVLEKMFHALEYTIMFTKGRDQTCIYHKIRKAVENMCHRNFEIRHLAQIRKVYPEAYKYTSVQTVDNGVRVTSVCIDIPDKGATQQIISTPLKDTTASSIVRGGTLAAPVKSAVDSRGMMDKANGAGKLMGERRKEFHRRLLELVKAEHKKFLETLPYSIATGNADKDAELRAWHPKFDLNDLPELNAADMPELKEKIPDFRVASRKRVKEDQEQTNKELGSQLNLDGNNGERPTKRMRLEAGLTKVNNVATLPVTPSKPPQPIIMPETPTKPKSRAAALLERVRERERKKLESEMYSKKPTPQQIRKKAMLSRLGDLAQTLNFLYVSSQKNVMPMSTVANHISNSLSASLSEAEAREHIKLLAEVAPEWCKLTDLDIGTVLRFDRNVEVKRVREKVQEAMAQVTNT